MTGKQKKRKLLAQVLAAGMVISQAVVPAVAEEVDPVMPDEQYEWYDVVEEDAGRVEVSEPAEDIIQIEAEQPQEDPVDSFDTEDVSIPEQRAVFFMVYDGANVFFHGSNVLDTYTYAENGEIVFSVALSEGYELDQILTGNGLPVYHTVDPFTGMENEFEFVVSGVTGDDTLIEVVTKLAEEEAPVVEEEEPAVDEEDSPEEEYEAWEEESAPAWEEDTSKEAEYDNAPEAEEEPIADLIPEEDEKTEEVFIDEDENEDKDEETAEAVVEEIPVNVIVDCEYDAPYYYEDEITLTAEADGEITWEMSLDGTSWDKVSEEDAIRIVLDEENADAKWRAVAEAENAEGTSEEYTFNATEYIPDSITITEIGGNGTVHNYGDVVTYHADYFTLSTNPHVVWEGSRDGETWFELEGDGAELTIIVDEETDGIQVRAKLLTDDTAE